MKTKRIEWSHATSDNAKQFGFYKTGCYTVEIISSFHDTPTPVAGFSDLQSARAHAETLPETWDKLTR